MVNSFILSVFNILNHLAEGSYGLFEYRFSLSAGNLLVNKIVHIKRGKWLNIFLGYSHARAASVTSKQVIMDKTVYMQQRRSSLPHIYSTEY